MVEKKIEKTYIPGSEWLYYKVYCGEKTAEDVLLTIVKPLVAELLEDKTIDKWFFIRYSDPESHLRIRFHLTNQKYLGDLMQKVMHCLLPFVESNQIWDVQLGTYQRELKRYGENTIEEAESYFFYDSQEVIKVVEQSKNNDQKRFELVLKTVLSTITLFDFEPKEVEQFLNKMQLSFKNEFEVNGGAKKILGKKYREFLNDPNMDALLKTDKHDGGFEAKKIIALQYNKENGDSNKEEILASLIHMTINRSFTSQQRLQEMMIYDFLYKLYKETKYVKK